MAKEEQRVKEQDAVAAISATIQPLRRSAQLTDARHHVRRRPRNALRAFVEDASTQPCCAVIRSFVPTALDSNGAPSNHGIWLSDYPDITTNGLPDSRSYRATGSEVSPPRLTSSMATSQPGSAASAFAADDAGPANSKPASVSCRQMIVEDEFFIALDNTRGAMT